MARIALVACTKRKSPTETTAERLYTSPLFKAAREYALLISDRWYILSARYGLLRPDDPVSPYDETLKTMNPAERHAWAGEVITSLKKVLRCGDTVTFLAGLEYRRLLVGAITEMDCEIAIPLEGLSIGRQVQWLQSAVQERSRPYWLNRFYRQLTRLQDGLGGFPLLRDCDGRTKWPMRGVYFFFEPDELRRETGEMRVVRVGTHAVSMGSSSTLWGRLRTHRGGSDGSGNHRGSIFRLHVGSALIQRDSLQKLYPSWGQGQSAPVDVREQESPLERLVSVHIGRMSIAWLAVDDPPSAKSDRRFIERNTIALLTSPMLAQDSASTEWLGRFSPHPSIRHSGLWNVLDFQGSFDPKFFEVLDYYIDVTLGLRHSTQRSIAPAGDHRLERSPSTQQELFPDD